MQILGDRLELVDCFFGAAFLILIFCLFLVCIGLIVLCSFGCLISSIFSFFSRSVVAVLDQVYPPRLLLPWSARTLAPGLATRFAGRW